MSKPEPSVVLFDGVCNLCNSSVQFIIDRDPSAHFRFAALQSPEGAALLERHGQAERAKSLSSVLLVEDGHVYGASTAALRIARRLRGGWKLFGALLVIPRPLRDWAYAAFASRRYRWFGKTDSCRIPTPELRARFL